MSDTQKAPPSVENVAADDKQSAVEGTGGTMADLQFPELAELEDEIKQQIRSNRRFLDRFMDEDFADEDFIEEDEGDAQGEPGDPRGEATHGASVRVIAWLRAPPLQPGCACAKPPSIERRHASC